MNATAQEGPTTMPPDLAVLADRLDRMESKVDEMSHVLVGNGDPTNCVVWRLGKLQEGYESLQSGLDAVADLVRKSVGTGETWRVRLMNWAGEHAVVLGLITIVLLSNPQTRELAMSILRMFFLVPSSLVATAPDQP